MGWLIALGIIVLLMLLPLGVTARYGESGALVKAIAGPARIRLYPRKKKEKKPKPEKPAEKEKTASQAKEPAEKGGSWKDFLPLVRTALDFLGDLRRKLRVERLELKLILAGDDPADLAQNYGRIWAAVGNLFPLLERAFVIKKRDVEVECDFVAEETRVAARLDLTITLGRLLVLVVRYGIRILRQYLKIQKQRKGGTAT